MNRLLRISFAGCCVVMLMGCRSVGTPPAVVGLPATSAPEIPLRLASSSSVVGCDITFDDQRPDYERRYYPGTCEPRRWHDAMSFVPMESFVPSIEDQLRQRVAAAVESIASETDHATMTLTSFQFAFDQREDIQGEYLAEYANWAAVKDREDEERQASREATASEQQARREEEREMEQLKCREARADKRMHDQSNCDKSAKSGLFNEIFGEIFGEIFFESLRSLLIDIPRSLSRDYGTRKRTLVEAQTLPTEIADGKQTGLNCQIHATVIFAGRKGAEVERTIRIHRHAPLAADGSLKDQTAAFIEAALEEFSSSI